MRLRISEAQALGLTARAGDDTQGMNNGTKVSLTFPPFELISSSSSTRRSKRIISKASMKELEIGNG